MTILPPALREVKAGFQQPIDDFMGWLALERGLAENTRRPMQMI